MECYTNLSKAAMQCLLVKQIVMAQVEKFPIEWKSSDEW